MVISFLWYIYAMQKRLSISNVEKAVHSIDPVFLNSPQFFQEPLGESLACRLLLKVETLNPVRSFKGRGADLLVSNSKEDGLLCASAGNFGQAMAYACRKAKKKLIVYASTKANPLKIDRMKGLGAEVILFGDDFDAAKAEAKRVATVKKIRFVEDAVDLETLTGAATIGVELLCLKEQIDFVLVPLGNGALLNGVARIYKEYSPSTRIIAVQAKGAPAMVESWKEGTLKVHEQINTIADGIGVRIPIPQALEDMDGLVDDAYLVKEDTIIHAMKLIHMHAGIVAEPSAVVGIAAVIENRTAFRNKSVATIITGGNVSETHMDLWL
jgi:threonine dehydratase